MTTATTTYSQVCCDYTGNSDGNFDSHLAWGIYAHSDESDWLWNRKPVGIYIEHKCQERFFVVWDSVADAGFFDWTIGWYCDEVSREPISEHEWDRFGPKSKSLDMVPSHDGIADMINVEASQGYCSDPTSRLSDILDTDDCYWLGDAAYVRESESGHVYRCMPQFCTGDGIHDVTDIPRDGWGWLSDCSIDSDAWIEAILNSGNAREYTHEMAEWLDNEGNASEFEGAARTAQAFAAIIAIADSE